MSVLLPTRLHIVVTGRCDSSVIRSQGDRPASGLAGQKLPWGSARRLATSARRSHLRLALLACLGLLLLPSVAAASAGDTWTSRTTPADSNWDDITYGGGTFVAVAGSGAGHQVMTSTDGITWLTQATPVDNLWSGVTYGDGLFVAVSASTSGNRVMSSPDGSTWTSQASAADNFWTSVAYGEGTFVAVAQTGTNRVMTSTDGVTWTSQTAAVNNDWIDVTYGNGLFVAVASTGTGNRAMWSTDGTSWTASTTPADSLWAGVAFGEDTFVAVAQSGTGQRAMTSPDGVTWTLRSTPADNNWFDVTDGDGVFVAVAMTGAGNRVMTSPDGITWTIGVTPVDNNWRGVAYGDGLFAAVSFGGTGNSVMTSGELIPPAEPVTFNSAPPETTVFTSAEFDFSAGAATSFECHLNDRDWEPCASPETFTGLHKGDNVFSVRVAAAAEQYDYAWTIAAAAPSGDDENHLKATVSATIRVAPLPRRHGALGTSVGCAVTGELVLESCVVDIYAPRRVLDGTGHGLEVSLPRERLIKIGTGRFKTRNTTTKRALVVVLLNGTGRRILGANLNGFPGTVVIRGFPKDALGLTISRSTRFRPPAQVVAPADGLFSIGAAALSSTGQTFIGSIAQIIPKRVKSVACVGYTDSTGSTAANDLLGQQRAEVVCAALAAAGITARSIQATSAGESHPRATNATAAGRALNRRIAITITY